MIGAATTPAWFGPITGTPSTSPSPTTCVSDELAVRRSLPPQRLPFVVPRVWLAHRQIARGFYDFFLVVVITYKTKAAACRALTFIVRIFVNDTVAIAVWTSFSFHVWT